jgi:hypothetical protein
MSFDTADAHQASSDGLDTLAWSDQTWPPSSESGVAENGKRLATGVIELSIAVGHSRPERYRERETGAEPVIIGCFTAGEGLLLRWRFNRAGDLIGQGWPRPSSVSHG